MDRPEDFEPNPVTGKVYVALTNNSKRGTEGKAAADEANPRNNNKNGQVLEIDDDHAGTSFTWNLLLVCGDPTRPTPTTAVSTSQGQPDLVPRQPRVRQHGNLWVATDGNTLDPTTACSPWCSRAPTAVRPDSS